MESTPRLARDLARGAGAATLWKAFQVVGVKGIFLLRLVILARLLTPADYGLFAIAVGALALANSMTNLGVKEALVQRASPGAADYHAGWSLGLARGLVLCGVLLAIAPVIAWLFAEPRAADLIRVIALVPLVDALASVRLADAIRNLRFRSIAFAELAKSAANTVVAVALASSLGVWALVAGQIAASLAFVLCTYLIAPYRPRLVVSAAGMKPLLVFGRWVLLTGLIAEGGTLALRGIVSHQLGTAELGLYFLAASVALLPAALAAETIGSVAFPLYARIRNDAAGSERALRAVTVSMGVVIIPASLLIAALAPAAVDELFGSKWLGAVVPMQILAFVCIAGVLGEAFTPLFMATGRPELVTRVELAQTVCLIVLVAWLAGTTGLAGVAFATVAGTALAQPLALLYARRTTGKLPAGIGRCLAAIMFAAGVGCAAAWSAEKVLAGVAGLLVSAALGVTVSAAVLWAADRLLALRIREDFLRAMPQLSLFRRYADTR